MITLVAYGGAAMAEIAGCFSFWAWLRLGKSAWWLPPGLVDHPAAAPQGNKLFARDLPRDALVCVGIATRPRCCARWQAGCGAPGGDRSRCASARPAR
jgi:hypothetical protein